MVEILYQTGQFIIPSQIIFLLISSIVISLFGVFMSKSLNSTKEVLLAKINKKIMTEITKVVDEKQEIYEKYKDQEKKPDHVSERLKYYENYYKALIDWRSQIKEKQVKHKLGVRDLEKIEENLDLFDTIYEKRIVGSQKTGASHQNMKLHESG